MLQATLTAYSCQSWCTSHANGTPAGQHPAVEDQLCTHRITSPAFGEILASYSQGDGPMINLYGTREELTLGQAEQLAYALLASVASARTAVAA